jgi:ParB family chromosome partitioning protein
VSRKLKKNELGKGIRALLSSMEEGNIDNPGDAVKTLSSKWAEIPLSKISANPFQPRTEFDPAALEELATSIRTYGLIQPVTVSMLANGSFQLISGERRWRAAKLAGLRSVPAFIRIADDQGLLEMALVENIQREDLNPLEIAFTYKRLIDECNLSQEALSTRVGKQRSTVSNYIRLLKLPAEIQKSIKEGNISMGHARAIAGLKEPKKQANLLKQILAKQLSVRDVEDLVSNFKSPSTRVSRKQVLSPELQSFEKQLKSSFGTKAKLRMAEDKSGSILIPYHSQKQLEELMRLLFDK